MVSILVGRTSKCTVLNLMVKIGKKTTFEWRMVPLIKYSGAGKVWTKSNKYNIKP